MEAFPAALHHARQPGLAEESGRTPTQVYRGDGATVEIALLTPQTQLVTQVVNIIRFR